MFRRREVMLDKWTHTEVQYVRLSVQHGDGSVWCLVSSTGTRVPVSERDIDYQPSFYQVFSAVATRPGHDTIAPQLSCLSLDK